MSAESLNWKTDSGADFPWSSLGLAESVRELEQRARDQKEREPYLRVRPFFTVAVVDTLACAATAPTPAVSRTLHFLRQQVYSAMEVIFVRERSDALLKAKGEWLIWLEAGDVLSPLALFQLAVEIERAPDAGVLYTNEVRHVGPKQTTLEFFSKRPFSLFTLRQFNYIGNCFAVRTQNLQGLGAFSPEVRGSETYDLLLRLTEKKTTFVHCPFFFFHSFQPSAETKENTKRILQAHLERSRISALFPVATTTGWHPKITDPAPSIDAIICFRDRCEWTVRAARELAARRGKSPIRIWFVDNDSNPTEVEKMRRELRQSPLDVPWEIVSNPGPFNYAAMHNRIVGEKAHGDLLLLLNNDVWLHGSWNLDEWVGWAIQPEIGTVGIRLQFPYGVIQHGGVGAKYGGEARLARLGHWEQNQRFTRQNREVYCNTFAACMLKRSLFESAGPLRPADFPNGYGDVVFHFTALRQGFTHVYLGTIEGTHVESASRGIRYEYWEEVEFERRFGEFFPALLREDFGINRVPGREDAWGELILRIVKTQLRKGPNWMHTVRRGLKQIWQLWQKKTRSGDVYENSR